MPPEKRTTVMVPLQVASSSHPVKLFTMHSDLIGGTRKGQGQFLRYTFCGGLEFFNRDTAEDFCSLESSHEAPIVCRKILVNLVGSPR